MPLTSGTRLGRYEIVTPLGAGGMGEVYRARDTQLARSVAIKVLRLETAGDESVRARFRREAEAIAALKHPHVCVLYDVSSDRDLDFLVMEHLEGETLADRLRRGPLPFDQVLRHGIEIASALESAHRQGFVHRDLKPGNVMLTANGAKVLDFGLAKPIAGARGAEGAAEITRPQPLTNDGAILGTLGYMAPEQLEGRPADARSDLFALGAMLWEMASGRRVFAGATQAGMIAAVLTSGPPQREPGDPPLPELFEKVVAKCLARDPDLRWQSASDLADALRWSGEARTAAPQEVSSPARSSTGWLVAGGAALVAVLAVALLLAQTMRPSAAGSSAGPLRLSIVPPPGTTFTPRDISGHAQFAASPDGSRIAFVAARRGAKPQLWVRSLESAGATPLPGTEEANTSDESGDWEVYVQAFPGGGGKWQVSSGGGSQPFWRADDKELFYLDGDGFVVAVPVSGTEAFDSGRTERLFPSRQRPMLAPYRGTYAVTPDGQRFLVESLLPDADPSTITVLLDWQGALRKSIDARGD